MTPVDRAALLARLPVLGFVPPEDAAPWARAARSAAFAAAVEAFAAAYWSLAPADRRERYNQLWEARYGSAAARLGLLRSGLDRTRESAGDPGPTTHDELVRELAASRRRAAARRYKERRSRAVASDRRTFDLADLVSHWQTSSLAGLLSHPLVHRWMTVGAVAAVVLWGALMLWLAFFPDSFPGGRPQPQTTFTPDEVQRFQRYQTTPGGSLWSVPPAGYDDWVRAGRPAGKTPR